MRVWKLFCAVGLAAIASQASAAILTLNPSHDTSVWNRVGQEATYNDANFGSSTELEIYHFDDNLNGYSYIRFDVPALGPGQTITAANLHLDKVQNMPDGFTGSDRNDTITDGRIAIYGLLDVAGNTSQTWDEALLTASSSGAELNNGSTVDVNVFDPPTRSINFDGQEIAPFGGTTVDLNSADFLNFVISRAGSSATVMLDYADATAGRGWAFGSKESSTPPTLTLTIVPEPTALALLCLGGLAACGRRRVA